MDRERGRYVLDELATPIGAALGAEARGAERGDAGRASHLSPAFGLRSGTSQVHWGQPATAPSPEEGGGRNVPEPQGLRKARGAFLTPEPIARFIARWAIRSEADRVLEPSCGEAAFMLAAADRKQALGAGLFAGEGLHGVELHRPSAHAARELLSDRGVSASIAVGDFFDFKASPTYDVVIGNPPYVRYQGFAGEARRKAQEAALSGGVRLSGLASSWAAFVVYASQFLRDDGRLGLVLPGELLAVGYAAEVRRFLLQRFADVRLVMFDELVFPGVQEEVVLLLAEGSGSTSHFKVFQAEDASRLDEIDRLAWTSFAPNLEGKWTPALLTSDELGAYRDITAGDAFADLLDWGETYLGIVTGNNRYFTLSPSEIEDQRIPERDLLPVSPPGSKHLRGLTFTTSVWKELLADDRPGYLFCPRDDEPSDAVSKYIEAGETTGVHRAYKCRVRSPWWRVPLVDRPDILLTYMDKERPRFVTNRAGVYHLNSLYGITLRRGLKRLGQDLLPIASLNSVTTLGAEIVGRAYGGGLLKLEPTEADRLPVPSPALVETTADALRALRPQLSTALRNGDLARAIRLVDRIVLIEGVGMSHDQLTAVRNARETLFGRRNTRSTSGR